MTCNILHMRSATGSSSGNREGDPPVIRTRYFDTRLGELVIGTLEDRLCLCDWRCRKMRRAIDERIRAGTGAVFAEGTSELIRETMGQLTEYFEGSRTRFDLPLLLVGSDFQKQVWNELLRIPFGHTETYAGLARRLGDVRAIRAVAAANGANALSIIVPCHRVLGSNGRLTGYAGGLEAKKGLLRHEKAWLQGELDFRQQET
jgi:methylated-DNA-[protein]-cysteine S-methyltransferase